MASVLLSLGRALATPAATRILPLSSKPFSPSTTKPLLFPGLSAPSPLLSLERGLKHKETVRKRCKNCYFEVIDEVKYVFCTAHPRHKQAEKQKIPFRKRMIMTHATQGGYNHGNGKGRQPMWTQSGARMDF